MAFMVVALATLLWTRMPKLRELKV